MRGIFCVCLTLLLVGLGTAAFGQERVWIAEKGNVSFVSDAPLEIIKAHSPNLRGVIDPGTKTFAFIVNMNSFMGFNSEIQHVHFM
ncbi:MAG TPA: hypothetical protein VJ508_09970, partial [Saprospiraceae bacterium]|nr:hypothetical protein [Saprospiraceae bacterium]